MKISPPYKHLVQKPYLCASACVQMILLRRNLGWIDQEEIAQELGTRITADVKKAFTVKLRITTVNNFGLRLGEFKQNKVKDFFRRHKLPLQAKVFYSSEIKDVKSFLEGNLKGGDDVMANFWLTPFRKADFGHFALISEISGDKVVFCDPEKHHKSFWEANIKKLKEAMGKKFDGRERGFVVFSKH